MQGGTLRTPPMSIGGWEPFVFLAVVPKGYIIPCKRFNPYLPIRPWDKCDGGLKLKVLVLIQGTDIRRAKAQPVLVLILAFHGITLGCLMGHIVF